MADAGGGGGNTWGTFEIIIVILLAIGLLSQLMGKPISSPGDSSSTVTQSDTVDTAQPACGLAVSRPHSLESIYGFVTLIGRTEGCEWLSTDRIALYAQVVDARGKPVSDYTTVPPTSFDGDAIATFNTTINITATPAKGNGYLILISPSSSSTTYRIPLRFK